MRTPGSARGAAGDGGPYRHPEYRYTVAEYEPARPWVLVGPLREHSVELDEGEEFTTWAAQAWPRPRYQVDLPPELGPWQGAG